MRQLRYLGLILLILSSFGCHARVQFPSEITSSHQVSIPQKYWMWGLVGGRTYELYKHCRGGRVYEVHTHATMTQGIFTVLSLGVYSPRTMTITCSGKVKPFKTPVVLNKKGMMNTTTSHTPAPNIPELLNAASQPKRFERN